MKKSKTGSLFRFRVRTFLMAAFLIATVIGYVSGHQRSFQREQAALKTLKNLSVVTTFQSKNKSIAIFC